MPTKSEDTAKGARSTRCVALVGPQGTGKTTLAEAMLFAAGAIPHKGTVSQGNDRSATPARKPARATCRPR